MPPKAAGKEKIVDSEEVLQAVVIAETFNERFKPLTTNKPRCLVPMCNAPLLDWTFESLAVAGVHEVFVMCQSHFESIDEAIRASKWSQPGSPLKIQPMLLSSGVGSFGDAIRQVDAQSIIKNDFVLVSGDMVSNVRIDEIVRVHKERRKVNKDVIMTCLVKECGVGHRTRPKGETAVWTLDKDTKECLNYEGVPAVPKLRKATIPNPKVFLKTRGEIEIRNDLIDCGIDVCSAEVPLLFQENFHSEDLRRDFVNDILQSDILDKKIYCYFADDGYAARVRDTKTYAAVSKDILGRWTFPLVPDDNHPGGHHYEHQRGNKYIATGKVALSRTCKIGNNTLIGANSRIHDHVELSHSVLGQGCTIKDKAVVRDSYLWDGVEIGPKCIVEESILAANVTLSAGCTIRRGCLIGEGVFLGLGADLAEFSRVAKRPANTAIEYNMKLILGEGSNATLFRGEEGGSDDENSDGEDEDDDFESVANLQYLRLGDRTAEASNSESGVSESEDENPSGDEVSDTETAESSVEPHAPNPWAALKWKDEFGSEAYQTLQRGITENLRADDVVLELKTLRMANNADMSRVEHMVVAAFVRSIELGQNTAEQKRRVGTALKKWSALITALCRSNMAGALSRLQTICAASDYRVIFGTILAVWYEADLVDEDDIKKWHSSPTAQGIDVEPDDYGGELKKLWAIGGRLLAHLESDDESEEDSEDDSEDDGPAARTPAPGTGSSPAIRTAVEESDDGEGGTEESDDEEAPSKATAAVHAAKTAALPPILSSSAPTVKPNAGPLKQTEESEGENSEDDESEDEDEPPASKPTVAVKSQATPRTTALPNQGVDEEESEGETDDDESEEETPARNPQSALVGASQNRPTKPMPPPVLAKPSISKPIATQKHQAAGKGKAVAAPATEESEEDEDEEDDDDDEEEEDDEDGSEDETHAVLTQRS